jgi:hypothetical protein
MTGYSENERWKLLRAALHLWQSAHKLGEHLSCLLLSKMVITEITKEEPKQGTFELLNESFEGGWLPLFQPLQRGLPDI